MTATKKNKKQQKPKEDKSDEPKPRKKCRTCVADFCWGKELCDEM